MDSGSSWISPAAKDFIAGAVSGGLSVVAGQPLDTIRVRQQNAGSTARGLFPEGVHIFRHEGVRALFKGMSSPLTTITVQNAVVFQAYGVAERSIREYTHQDPAAPSTYSTIAASGLLAGLAQTLIITPIDLVKIRLMMQFGNSNTHLGVLGTIRSIWAKEGGMKGLFRGYPVTIVRDTPSTAVWYGSYQVAQDIMNPGRRDTGEGGTVASTLIAGGLAGMLSWGCIYPIDTIKTRIQSSKGEYPGWISLMRSAVKKDGWGSLFPGFGATQARGFVVNAVIFAGFEATMGVLNSLG